MVLWDRDVVFGDRDVVLGTVVPVLRRRGTDCCGIGEGERDSAEVVGGCMAALAYVGRRQGRRVVLGGRVRVRRGLAVGKPVSVLSFRE